MLPPGYEAGKRYPLLIEVYPIGLPSTCRTLKDTPRAGAFVDDLWASRGMIHVRPAIPLDLIRTEAGPIAGLDEIVDQTIDALVEQGFVDPGRVAVFGFSQGGIFSLYAATQSQRYAAVISVNGWSDYFSHYFGPRGLMRYFHLDQNGGDNLCPFGFGLTPYDDPALYASNSPVALTSGITAPVLLVHSDFDYFDISQYDEMFGALSRAGKEAIYLRYWGEGHGPSSPANIQDIWRRIDTFLRDSGVLQDQG